MWEEAIILILVPLYVFVSEGDEGRGVGLVYTVRALDREEGRLMLVPLVVADAGRRSATVTLTLHVADLNDNPMTPAAKTVTVHTVKVSKSSRQPRPTQHKSQ